MVKSPEAKLPTLPTITAASAAITTENVSFCGGAPGVTAIDTWKLPNLKESIFDRSAVSASINKLK